MAWVAAKHLFSDTTENLPQALFPTGQNVCEKPCRIGVEAGNLAADVFRQKFLGFGRTPPIMEAEGKLIVHPTLAGKDLKVEGLPIYEAIKAATPQGAWVKYVWKEKEKNTYIKRTSNNLIVGS